MAMSVPTPDAPPPDAAAPVRDAGLWSDAWRQLRFRRKEQGGWMRGLRFLLAR